MDRKLLRGLAIGFFLSGLILLFFPQEQPKKVNVENNHQPNEELVSQVETLQKQNKDLTKENSQLQEQVKEKNETIDQSDEQTEGNYEIVSYQLTIESGMDSKQISQRLANEQIILHSDDLNDWLTIQNLHRSIQVGTYDLRSDLSIKEIAEMITK